MRGSRTSNWHRVDCLSRTHCKGKFAILNSIQFTNRRATSANILLIRTALVLLKSCGGEKPLLSREIMRAGVMAYTLLVRESKRSNSFGANNPCDKPYRLDEDFL